MWKKTTAQQAQDLDKKTDRRLKFLIVLGGFVWLILVGRLFWIQVVKKNHYQSLAKTQYQSREWIQPNRGIVYDRNFNKLATNLAYYSFGIHPKQVKSPEKIAARFSVLFHKSKAFYLKKIKSSKSFVWLERKVDEQTAKKIESFEGLTVKRNLKRNYPYGRTAAHVTGYTDIDNKGLSGIELKYNYLLEGLPGWRIQQRDAFGEKYPSFDYPHKDPVDGKSVVLTLDLTYQLIAQEELAKTVQHHRADNGAVIIVAPSTGEILAMAAAPDFDPNRPEAFPDNIRKNRVITNTYEPGSTFKIVTATGLLEEKIFAPSDSVFCENGKYQIYDKTITDHGKKYGWLSFLKVISNSSNIGTAKLAKKLDKGKLYQYSRAFGFGEKTGIEMVGEVKGILKNPVEWSGLTLSSISYGYEVAVTALQVANAYCAIANDGILMKSKLIHSIVYPDGKIEKVFHPEKIRRVASKTTMDTLSTFLRDVVISGTGKKAYIEGLDIAGKTGTAQKINASGTYSQRNHVASFVGFFPADDPQLLCFIVVDNPKKGLYSGGEVAAPTFKRIVQRIINASSDFNRNLTKPLIVKKQNDDNGFGFMPNFVNTSVKVAKAILEDRGLEAEFISDGDMVIAQEPFPGEKLEEQQKIQLILTKKTNILEKERIKVPDVRGLSIRRAMNSLSASGIDVKIIGSGVVYRQTPSPGKWIRKGRQIKLECRIRKL